MSGSAQASAPQTPDPNYEFFSAPKYVDFNNLPTDAELDAWFAQRGDSSPTFVKAPVLFRLDNAEQSPQVTAVGRDDDMMSAASNDTGLVPINVALAEQFDNLGSDADVVVESEIDDNASEESFDSVATEIIHFNGTPTTPAVSAATPQTAKTAQMLLRCDAAQDDLTQRINLLKSQIQQLRATVPQAPAVQPPPPTTPRPTDPSTPRAATSGVNSAVNTPRSAYLEAVARIKKNIGLVANKETELQQLQDLQREMHLSGNKNTDQLQQQQKHRHHRHSSVYRSGGAARHTSAVRVMRTESTFSTPHEKRNMERTHGDLTAPIRLMATGPMRVVDPSAAPPQPPQPPTAVALGAATPGTVKRQQSLMMTGALRIDTATAIDIAAREMSSDSEDDDFEPARPARPSSTYRRHSHAQPETPRRSHSHRTPRSPLMYDEQEVGVVADAERHRHRHRRHHRHHHHHRHAHATPRSALRGVSYQDPETPRSTLRTSHRRRTDVEDTARTTRKERHRRSHSHHRSSNHLRTGTAPSTPHSVAPVPQQITRQRSTTIGAIDDQVRRQLAGALEQVQCNDLPRFMQPTESAAMRIVEQQNERKAAASTVTTNPRDHWDIVQPSTVKHSISQLDREAVRRVQAAATLSPPPLPPPPMTAPQRQLVRGWTLRPVNDPTALQSPAAEASSSAPALPPQPQAAIAAAAPVPAVQRTRPVARTESMATAAPVRTAAPVARSTTMTSVATARQPFAPQPANNTRPSSLAQAPKAKPRDERDRALSTEEREMLAIAEARRKLHQHVMAKTVGMPKFIRRPATSTNHN